MSSDPPSRPPPVPLPPEFVLDDLTWYIYKHFSYLLTNEELAAQRARLGRVKQWAYDPNGNKMIDFLRVPEVQASYPELMQRIDAHGFGVVMRAAADRALRDNPDKKILHTCTKCGELCRTPQAQQCFACGFDWHPPTGV